MRRVFDVTVTRDAEWWMIAIPQLDGLTQARNLAEAPAMAAEYIAAALDMPLGDVEVRITQM